MIVGVFIMSKKMLGFILKQFEFILLVVVIFLMIASSNKKEVIYTYNVNEVNSIQAIHLVSKYNSKYVETIFASSFSEVLEYGSNNPVVYDGTMTAYGPDCVGCTGMVSCPPRQDVRNGNIYYNDSQYGEVMIAAADSSIPCGTIVNVYDSTLSKNGPFTAIVLDRGGVIKGTLMDLLVVSEKASSSFGRQKVKYEIVRWGW